MSRWILPTHDGASPSDQVTRQPLVVRINGQIGSEQAHRLAQNFNGEISQFYISQVQKRALSGLEIYKTQMSAPGIGMTYTYNHGQEYLDIRVSDTGRRRGPPDVEDFWDYALVELVVPNMYYAQGAYFLEAFAHMTSPKEADLTSSSRWPTKGVAWTPVGLDLLSTPDPILSAANTLPVTRTALGGGTESVFSLTVDLIGSRGGVATFDLYPYIYTRDALLPAYTFYWDDALMPVPPDALPPFPTYAGLVPVAQISPPYPTTPPDIEFVGGEWVFVSSGDHGPVQVDMGLRYSGTFFSDGIHHAFEITNAGMDTSAPDYQVHHLYYHWALATDGAGVDPYTGPPRVPAELRVTLFKGHPVLNSTDFQMSPIDYIRWTLDGTPVAPMLAFPTSVPAYGNTNFPTSLAGIHFYTFNGIPKLGTVSLDTHRLIRGRPEIIMQAGLQPA